MYTEQILCTRQVTRVANGSHKKFRIQTVKCRDQRDNIIGYTKYYSVTKMLLALGLPSFDTVIHNYRNSFLCVRSNHSNDMVKLLRCVCPSAFLLCFIVHLVLLFPLFYLYCLQSVCLSVFMSVAYVYGPCCLISIK